MKKLFYLVICILITSVIQFSCCDIEISYDGEIEFTSMAPPIGQGGQFYITYKVKVITNRECKIDFVPTGTFIALGGNATPLTPSYTFTQTDSILEDSMLIHAPVGMLTGHHMLILQAEPTCLSEQEEAPIIKPGTCYIDVFGYSLSIYYNYPSYNSFVFQEINENYEFQAILDGFTQNAVRLTVSCSEFITDDATPTLSTGDFQLSSRSFNLSPGPFNEELSIIINPNNTSLEDGMTYYIKLKILGPYVITTQMIELPVPPPPGP